MRDQLSHSVLLFFSLRGLIIVNVTLRYFTLEGPKRCSGPVLKDQLVGVSDKTDHAVDYIAHLIIRDN